VDAKAKHATVAHFLSTDACHTALLDSALHQVNCLSIQIGCMWRSLAWF
jgi:hypothetical protein